MSASRDVLETAAERVAAFCEKQSPAESRDSYRIEHSVRGASITVVELRPPWNPDWGSEWTSTKVAQLRYDERARVWTLYSAGSDDRWHAYEFAAPARDVTPLLEAIEEDRTGIFWG
jgi:hypothetical protein